VTIEARTRLSAGERREQLMIAAVETLAGRGYQSATAEEIARRAGVSKGLLWHYFADLDELFELTARRTLSALASAVAARIDLGAPAPDVIRSAILAAADLRVTHGAERAAMREIILNLRAPDGSLRLAQSDLAELRTAQAAIFSRGQAEGTFRASLNPLFLAVTYQGAVDSMLDYLDAYPETDAAAYAETVADVLLGGITRR
jgi:AcrR family transcriptional regulator